MFVSFSGKHSLNDSKFTRLLHQLIQWSSNTSSNLTC